MSNRIDSLLAGLGVPTDVADAWLAEIEQGDAANCLQQIIIICNTLRAGSKDLNRAMRALLCSELNMDILNSGLQLSVSTAGGLNFDYHACGHDREMAASMICG